MDELEWKFKDRINWLKDNPGKKLPEELEFTREQQAIIQALQYGKAPDALETD